jgi:hypothetical protein
MLGLSAAAHRVSPAQIDVPRDYNAAHDLIERNLQAGRKPVAYVVLKSGHAPSRAGQGIATARQIAPYTLQVSTLDRVRRGIAQDRRW